MPLLAGPFQSQWDATVVYVTGNIVFDRGGWWIRTAVSPGGSNSRPISGNTRWTLVAGLPYVKIVFGPAELVTAPFYDQNSTGPGVPVIPAPGARLIAMPVKAIARVTPGDPWSEDITGGSTFLGYDAAGHNETPMLMTVQGMNFKIPTSQPLGPTDYETVAQPLVPFTTLGDKQHDPGIVNLPLVLWTQQDLTNGGATFGTRSVEFQIWYEIVDADVVPAPDTFFVITVVDQTGGAGTNKFTVRDAGAVLSGVTGTFDLVGNTGSPTNNATYTLVSAVSGAGSTVLTVVQAIPNADPIGAIEASTLNFGGSGYGPTDTFTVDGGSGATGVVDTVGALGIVTGYHLTAKGSGYSVTAQTTTTTSGGGSGLLVNITVAGILGWATDFA